MDDPEEGGGPEVAWALQMVALVPRAEPAAPEPAAPEPAAPEPAAPEPAAPEAAATGKPATGNPATGNPATGLTVVDLATAAAVAAVRLLADPRSAPPGPWADAVARWDSGPIRKLVRRARGAAWDRVLGLDGLTVTHGTATVHVVPPGPVRPLPAELDRLQVSGLVAAGARPATWRAGPDWPGVRIALTPDAGLTAGKLAAQAAHAAHLSWRGMDPARRARWAAAGLAVEIAFPPPPRWTALLSDATVVVRDAGFTETVPGQQTALALP